MAKSHQPPDGLSVASLLAKLRPSIVHENEWEQLACVMLYLVRDCRDIAAICEAMVELQPPRREFWLRVNATAHDRFVRGLTHLFEDYRRET